MNRLVRQFLYPGLLLLTLSLLGGCVSRAPGGPNQTDAATGSEDGRLRTFVYECADGEAFTLRLEGGKAWLFLHSGTKSLARIRSGSGAKFSDGIDTYWDKGGEALFEIGGHVHRDCKKNRRIAVWEDAKLRGVDFRAVGNEPGWLLEIGENDRVLFVHDYGQQRNEFALTAPSTDNASRTTRYEMQDKAHRLTVTLAGRPCSDTMSGESFETTVELVFDGRRLAGCGRALH